MLPRALYRNHTFRELQGLFDSLEAGSTATEIDDVGKRLPLDVESREQGNPHELSGERAEGIFATFHDRFADRLVDNKLARTKTERRSPRGFPAFGWRASRVHDAR